MYKLKSCVKIHYKCAEISAHFLLHKYYNLIANNNKEEIEMINKSINAIKEYLINLTRDRKKMTKVLVVIIILFIAAALRIHENHKENVVVETDTSSQEEVLAKIYVDISGEVNNPGVYSFDEGARLYEIIEKAGGLTANADTNNINQAKFVEDGEKIVIPTINKTNDESGLNEDQSNGLININTASKDELMQLNGVGDAIADRIIEYRSTTQFKSIEDIMSVNGIGSATFEKIKAQITV